MDAGKRRDLSYTENQTDLEIRVSAHKEFANFQLEDWYQKNLQIPEGGCLLDIGCGNGIWLPTWSDMLGPQGLVVGIEKSAELIEKARMCTTTCRILILRMDFNDLGCFAPETFDVAVASYSIYYAIEAVHTLRQIRNLLKPGGHAYLVGPSEGNGAELFELNRKVFGFGALDRGAQRTTRLVDEFEPAARDIFSTVRTTTIPRKVTFPSVEEYVRYFMATLLFRESCEKAGRRPEREEIVASGWNNLELSRMTVMLDLKR